MTHNKYGLTSGKYIYLVTHIVKFGEIRGKSGDIGDIFVILGTNMVVLGQIQSFFFQEGP